MAHFSPDFGGHFRSNIMAAPHSHASQRLVYIGFFLRGESIRRLA
jgi:hypothetical protein